MTVTLPLSIGAVRWTLPKSQCGTNIQTLIRHSGGGNENFRLIFPKIRPLTFRKRRVLTKHGSKLRPLVLSACAIQQSHIFHHVLNCDPGVSTSRKHLSPFSPWHTIQM